MIIKDILDQHIPIFASDIWDSIVDEIREYIDPVDAEGAYTLSSIDEYIKLEFGEWEILPDLYSGDTIDQTMLQLKVDTIIAANRDYWIRYLESLQAQFDPLYNVDATEVTTSVFGQNQRTDVHGAKSRTDSTQYGARQSTTQYGQQEITAGSRQDTHGKGAQTDSHYETTMNDLTYKAKTKDEHAAYSDTDSIGSQTTTSGQHTDTFGQQAVSDSSSSSEQAYTDTSTAAEHTDTVTLRRYGNIGVTKSTDLLESFQEFARNSRIIPIIAVEISKALSFSVWY